MVGSDDACRPIVVRTRLASDGLVLGVDGIATTDPLLLYREGDRNRVCEALRTTRDGLRTSDLATVTGAWYSRCGRLMLRAIRVTRVVLLGLRLLRDTPLRLTRRLVFFRPTLNLRLLGICFEAKYACCLSWFSFYLCSLCCIFLFCFGTSRAW